jgi:hypothetical protein
MSAALAGIRVIDMTRAFGDYAVDVMAAPTFRFLRTSAAVREADGKAPLRSVSDQRRADPSDDVLPRIPARLGAASKRPLHRNSRLRSRQVATTLLGPRTESNCRQGL